MRAPCAPEPNLRSAGSRSSYVSDFESRRRVDTMQGRMALTLAEPTAKALPAWPHAASDAAPDGASDEGQAPGSNSSLIPRFAPKSSNARSHSSSAYTPLTSASVSTSPAASSCSARRHDAGVLALLPVATSSR